MDGKLVVIGTSTGGPKALQEVFQRLPGDLKAAFLIIQHMPPYFTGQLAKRLDSVSEMKVKEAEQGEEIKMGWAYLAPGDYHMEVIEKEGKLLVHLSQGETVNGHRPSVDVLMQSVSRLPYPKVGVILTGMGSDGAKGMEALKRSGAITIGESAETCVVYGMPKAACELGAVDSQVPLHQVADCILEALNKD